MMVQRVDLLEVRVFGGDLSLIGRVLKAPLLEVTYANETNVSDKNFGTLIQPYFNTKWYFRVSKSISSLAVKIKESETNELIAEQIVFISNILTKPTNIEMSTSDNRKVSLTLSINHIEKFFQEDLLQEESLSESKTSCNIENQFKILFLCTVILAISVFVHKWRTIQLESKSFQFVIESKVDAEPKHIKISSSKNYPIDLGSFSHVTNSEEEVPTMEDPVSNTLSIEHKTQVLEVVYAQDFDDSDFLYYPLHWKLGLSIISAREARSPPYSLEIVEEVELSLAIPASNISFWVKPATCGASELKILYHFSEKWVKIADYQIFGKEFREKVHTIPRDVDSISFQVIGQCNAFIDDIRIQSENKQL